MTRKKVREHLFQMLFVLDFYPAEELDSQVDTFLEGLGSHSESAKGESEENLEKVRAELKQKFYAVAEHQEEIDKKIEEKSNGWSLKRLAKADITALRLAIYEILYDEDVPAGVAVNEAVELAKRFGTDKSPSYVNGVLGSVVRDCTEE